MAIEGGWAWPRLPMDGRTRMHWFQEGHSLCGNWNSNKPTMYDLRASEYDCKRCRERLDKLIHKQVAGGAA